MTVITIIVLVLALAVPVVSSLQGNRSVEAGYNKVSAALAHARQIALYYRAPAGVVFFQDPVSGRQQIGYVMPVSVLGQNFGSNLGLAAAKAGAIDTADQRYIDLIPNEELVTFPEGVAVEVVNGNAQANGTILSSTNLVIGNKDEFLRVGVVLFDENGQLAPSASCWISPGTTLGSTLALMTPKTVGTGSLPYGSLTAYGGPVNVTIGANTVGLSLYSSPAVCIFDETAFKNQSSNTNGGSTLPFNDGNNNSILYYANFEVLSSANSSTSSWPATATTNIYTGATNSAQYIYLNQQSFTTFPGQGYFYTTGSNNPPNTTIGEVDQANEAQWLNTNGQIYAIKPNDGSLLKNQ